MKKIKPKSTVVTNTNSSKILAKNGLEDLTILKWNQTKKYFIKDCKIEITAIPAIHGVNPLSALLAGKVNGYYISIYKDEETFDAYITSDTVYKKQVIDAILGKNIDLMIPNMGAAKEGSWIMTLTLNTIMLKKMISKLNPKKVIPVHYGTFEHYVEPLEKIKNLKEERITLLGLGETYQL